MNNVITHLVCEKWSAPPATFPVEVSLVEVQLVRYPHNTLAEVLLVNDEVTAVLPSLHPDKVLGLVIILQMGQEFGHGDPLLTGEIHTVDKSELTLFLVFRYCLSCVLLLNIFIMTVLVFCFFLTDFKSLCKMCLNNIFSMANKKLN